MAQVINSPGLSALTGQSLGTGIGNALQQLAQNKVAKMHQQESLNKAAGFWEALGLPKETSMQFASAPEAVQKSLLDRLEGLGIGSNQQIPSDQLQSQQISQQQPQVQAQVQEGGLRIGANPAQKKHNELIAQKERHFQARQLKEENKENRIKQHEINKETQPLYDEINKEFKSVKPNNLRLNRIEKLNNEGNLGIPIFNSVLDTISKGVFGFGINLKNLMTKDAQELDKLSTDFIKGAKDIFGSRITDIDLQTFLQTIPTLYQSKEGRAAVINNMRLFNEAATIKKHAMDKIIEDNGGIRPYNLDVLIDKATQEPLDELSKKFTLGTPKEETSVLKKIGQGLGLTY